MYLDTTQIKNIYVDGNKIKKIYYDTALMWQSAVPVDKPTSTTVSETYSGGVISNGYTMPEGIAMNGTASATNAGTYTATYFPRDGYIWSDDTTDPVTVTLTIGRASVGAKPTTSVSKTYNGTSQNNGYTKPSGVNMTGNASAVNAGTYTATYTPDGNHKWGDDSTSGVTVTMAIARATITSMTLNTSTRWFNQASQSVDVASCKAGSLNATYSKSGTWSATSVGSYTATVNGTGNYQGSASASWSISYADNYIYYMGYMRSGSSTIVKSPGEGYNMRDTASIAAVSGGHQTTQHAEYASGDMGSPAYAGITFPRSWISGYSNVTVNYTVTFTSYKYYGDDDGSAYWNKIYCVINRDGGGGKSDLIFKHTYVSTQGQTISRTNEAHTTTCAVSQLSSGNNIRVVFECGSGRPSSYVNMTVKINSIILT